MIEVGGSDEKPVIVTAPINDASHEVLLLILAVRAKTTGKLKRRCRAKQDISHKATAQTNRQHLPTTLPSASLGQVGRLPALRSLAFAKRNGWARRPTLRD